MSGCICAIAGESECPVHAPWADAPPAAPELPECMPDQSQDIEAVRQAWQGAREECGEALEHVAELETEVLQLKAELRQYQPSDGMMVKLLGLNDVIREAARIFELLKLGKPGFAQITLADLHNWLEHPTVVRAVTSPLAQAEVKE